MLLSFHVVLLLIAISTRNWPNFQIVLFITLSAAVFCAQYINEFGNSHWKEFATQNYFDSNGLFISVLFSAPILVTVFTQMVHLSNQMRTASTLNIQSVLTHHLLPAGPQIMALITSARLVIKVKRAELRYKAKQEQQQKDKAGAKPKTE